MLCELRIAAAMLACGFSVACNGVRPAKNGQTQPEVKTMTLNPFSPKPTDGQWTRSYVEIQSTMIVGSAVNATSVLNLTGNLPTPCHELRLHISDAPDAQGVLRIDAWSVLDPDRICVQMLQPFSVQLQIRRNIAATVMVNGKEIGR